MKTVSRRIPIFVSLFLIWILASGFEDLEAETTAGIESIMDDLTGEDFEKIQIEDEWQDKVLANVEDYVTVRSEPDSESKALGRMFKGDGGIAVERLEGWTRVQSGNVDGYVSNDYLLFGFEAYEQAQEEVTLVATSLTGGLRIRSEASTEAKILKNVGEGTKLDVVAGEETEGAEWIHIQYAEEKTGYVSAEYVSVEFELGEAMTMDEIKKKEAEEKREKLKQQLESIKANGNEVALLAALIQAEGGNQPYDGQVAIGAVVMNRVKSGGYPNSIADVIYAPGQFGVVSNGTIARYLASPKASCMQAAQEAIGGYTTIGSYTHFRRAGAEVGPNSIVIGSHVFY
ncbi:MAG: SH3 domain-containing protein [Lachnospiraceae bacterium]|nr:SH3 domain-containing protein [Lachnospiraceae bacterium]